MKKRYILIFLVISFLFIVSFEYCTAFWVFTSKATYQNFGASVLVDLYPPDLFVDSPSNRTYNTPYVDLNYSVTDSASGINTTWYNLDGGDNFTIDSNVTLTINLSGSHILYVFANDSVNLENNSISISFFSNLNKTVLFSEFTGQFTTNFSDYSDEALETLTNVVLEVPDYGMISFLDTINISDMVTDLDSNIDITNRSIYINVGNLPNFDKPANLSLYNLTFTNPRILMDGSVCSSSVCTKESYVDGILTFNVTGFANYSVDETPSEQPSAAPSGGGGGGGGSSGSSFYLDFTVNPQVIKVKLYPGESSNEKFVITNKGNQQLLLSIDMSMVSGFATLSKDQTVLQPDQSDAVGVFFNVGHDKKPGVYTGRIVVEGNGQSKNVMLVVEVESPDKLLDVRCKVPENYKVVNPGNPVYSNIELFSMGYPGRVDVVMKYGVKDSNNMVISSESSTVAVETQISLNRFIMMPVDAPEGVYTFYVEATYNGIVATSTDEFQVVKLEVPRAMPVVSPYLFVGVGSILLIIILILIILWRLYVMWKRRKDKSDKKQRVVEPSKLEEKEKLLENLHSAGLISEAAYLKDKERIKHMKGDK
jgi:hypothetical protein